MRDVTPPPTPLPIGDEAPDFAAPHHRYGSSESKYRLLNRRGKKNMLLAFHPLAFTRISTEQLFALAERKAEFEALETDIAMVSVDHAETLHAWDLVHGGLGVMLISDFLPRGRIATMYGVLRPTEIAHRVTYVIDRHGKVAAVRMSPLHLAPVVDDLLAAVAEVQALHRATSAPS